MKANLLSILCGAAFVAISSPTLRAAPPPTPASALQSQPSTADNRQLEQMQARMKLLQEQMRRIREAKTPAERSKFLREHMHTMLEQMRAMRSMGGSMMSGMMGHGMMGGGMMRGGMGGGMRGEGMMGGGNTAATPAERRQWMQDRLDMMQMMMEQMMGQMQAMQGMTMREQGPHR